MAALCNRAGHYIFVLWFLLSIYLLLFSSLNLSRRRLDVYHTSTHGEFLVVNRHYHRDIQAAPSLSSSSSSSSCWLHFARVVDDAKCIVVTRVCVCVCVCMSVAACLHYCMDPDVTWRSSRDAPIVVQYWADLQSMYGLRCYGNNRNAWHIPAVIRQAHRTPHALRMPAKTALASDNACWVRDVICNKAVPFRPNAGRIVTRTRNVSECMLVLALSLVIIVTWHYRDVLAAMCVCPIFWRHQTQLGSQRKWSNATRPKMKMKIWILPDLTTFSQLFNHRKIW